MDYHLSYNLDYSEQSTWQVINATSFCRSSLIYTSDIGHFYCGKNYFTTRKGLNSYLIKITLSGAGLLTYNNQTYSIKPGQIFWIDCNQPQSYRSDPEAKNWDILWFHCIGSAAAAYYNQFMRNTQNCPVATLPPQSQVIKQFLNLEELYASKETQLVKDINASSLITQILVNCLDATFHSTQNIPEIVQEMMYYLQTHYTQKITLASLSSEFNLNQFYLQKLFKHWVGESPSEYIINLRLAKAKELLYSTQLSINEISYAVGIENASHFTRQFKSLEGISPQNFRKVWPCIPNKHS